MGGRGSTVDAVPSAMTWRQHPTAACPPVASGPAACPSGVRVQGSFLFQESEEGDLGFAGDGDLATAFWVPSDLRMARYSSLVIKEMVLHGAVPSQKENTLRFKEGHSLVFEKLLMGF